MVIPALPEVPAGLVFQATAASVTFSALTVGAPYLAEVTVLIAARAAGS